MNTKRPSAVTMLGIATAAVCLILMIIAGSLINADPSETWSAWVQAVGSIAAIMVGWIFMLWQHEKGEESKREDRRIFAAAFGIRLLPQLRELRRHFEFTIGAVEDAIARSTNPAAIVSYEDDGKAYHNITFVRENWSALAQMEGETARSVVSAASYYEAAHDLYDAEHDVMGSHTDNEGTNWFFIDLGSVETAKLYLQGHIMALECVMAAINDLSIAQNRSVSRQGVI